MSFPTFRFENVLQQLAPALNRAGELASSWLQGQGRIGAPPAWLQQELEQKLQLMANHLIAQEPAAQQRLRNHAGKRVRVVWQGLALDWQITPVGLWTVFQPSSKQPSENTASPDLEMELLQAQLGDLAQQWQQGQQPPMRVQGDVQLAAELAWCAQHVRWDYADDLSRVLGAAPAQMLVQAALALKTALQKMAQMFAPANAATPSEPIATPVRNQTV